ncbi:hypothetical protein [Sphingosinicella sp. BN140058]|uniref:hypothetical protein n=1 Tax=Sphingosinicella sp. BN140058 TaxID=1892855 RepID=UPI001013C025|nr:hypothetical protein [Sphingosinicella sp. BN140058]QAY76524.1 hypothetical protein ETR14_08465 [Sphingosinicella sp. BN140058]
MMIQAPFRLRAGTFDIAIAAFAAVAIGFAGFALPEWRLFQLLSLFHVPDLLPFANPPLGLKARAATAFLFGGGAFVGVFLLMRLLDRIPPARDPQDADETEESPIRLRRADAHPDAPARRPLVARDLGEPFELDQVADLALPAEAEAISARAREPELVEFVEIEPSLPPRFERVAAAPPRAAPAVEAPAPTAAPIPTLGSDLPPPSEDSLSTLMQRLESGLRRRETAAPPQAPIPAPAMPSPPPATHRAPTEDSLSERLRNAMNDLQRLAART